MSKANRKKEYDRLVSIGKLSQDDGCLVKEFGEPKSPAVEEVKKKKGKYGR